MAGFLSATATTPVVHNPAPGSVAGSVQLTSTATVTPTLVGIMGIGPVTVSAASTAQTAAYGLELALVLDNTGSMAGSSITSLISASNQLLGILYGGSDTQPHLWVSVVPFAAAVNIGNTHTGWLVAGSLKPSDYSPSSWMGCVMARTANTGATTAMTSTIRRRVLDTISSRSCTPRPITCIRRLPGFSTRQEPARTN